MRNQRVNENQCALLAAAITAGIVWLAGLSGCGVSAGGFVAGTTGYLKEYNAGQNRAVRIEKEQTYANR